MHGSSGRLHVFLYLLLQLSFPRIEISSRLIKEHPPSHPSVRQECFSIPLYLLLGSAPFAPCLIELLCARINAVYTPEPRHGCFSKDPASICHAFVLLMSLRPAFLSSLLFFFTTDRQAAAAWMQLWSTCIYNSAMRSDHKWGGYESGLL